MPITPTNKAKNSITPSNNSRKGGYATWGDTIVTWGDADYGWGSPYFTMVNLAKNIISPTNKTKN